MRIWIVVMLAAASGLAARAQAPAFTGGAAEVLVDVVVREKGGKLVKNLKPEEVSIAENGVAQKIVSFQVVRSAGTMAPGGEVTVQAARTGGLKVQRQIRLVSLVFERLGQESRRLARRAALDFLENDLGENVYYAVFYIDRTFRPILSYTNDKAKLREAIDLVTSVEKTTFASDAGTMTRPFGSTIATQRTGPSAPVVPATSGPGAAPDTAALTEYLQTVTIQAAADFSRRSDGQMFGQVSIFSLWGIISELGRLPGRKTMLLFSEGLTLQNQMSQQYESMISAANRANVTINTIDARGLIVNSDQAFANRLLGSAAETIAALPDAENGQERPTGYGKAELGFDFAMDSLKANNQMNLIDLAERTGGVGITNTNDFRKPLKQLSEEFNTYYEVSYKPTDASYDGRFRKIEVKVARPGAVVQARNGYFALPPMNGEAVFPFEAPLLVALGQTPLKKDVDFRAGVIQYGQKNGLQSASLVFELPRKAITFVPYEKEAGKSKTHVAVLALVKDEKGLVVAKLSRDLPLLGPTEKVEPYRAGQFVITRNVTLAPGRYTIESVAADFEGNKMGARRSVLVIPQQPPGPALSEMALVRRVDQADATRDTTDPLQLKSERVVPTLAIEVPEARNGALKIFHIAYPDGTQEKPQMVFDDWRGGQRLSRFQPTAPPPNEDGAIPYFLNLPMEQLRPGQYEIRAGLVQGTKGAQRSFFVTIF